MTRLDARIKRIDSCGSRVPPTTRKEICLREKVRDIKRMAGFGGELTNLEHVTVWKNGSSGGVFSDDDTGGIAIGHA